jgi:hypothetical protein
MATYKVGETYYYLGRTRCTVEAETLKGGGANIDEAVLQVRTANGTPILMLYKTAENYLSEKRIGLLQKWPLTPNR